MEASSKEILCIEFSNNLRQKALERNINHLKKKNTSLFLTPNQFKNDFGVKLNNAAWWKKILFYAIASIIYITLVPIQFLAGIYSKLFNKNDTTRKIKKLKLSHSSKLNYEVSESKLFSTLWTENGLSNYTFFNSDEQRQCIFEWVKILYGRTAELEKLAKDLQSEQKEYYSSFRKENPTGHISFVPIEVLLPEEIDQHFGQYIP